MMGYGSFLAANWRPLSFGAALTFISSFGQTYFVSIFNGEFQAAFALSHTDLGLLYSLATVASAVLLIWTGKFIDQWPLARYASVVLLAIAAGCIAISVAVSPLMLLAGFVIVRHAGQGLATHTGMTTLARLFDKGRATALSIAALGFALGQAVLPFLGVAGIETIGWRWVWFGIAAVTACVLLPAVRAIAGREDDCGGVDETAVAARDEAQRQAEPGPGPRQWTRAEVLRDPRFYLILPGVLASPFILTGLFFHQVLLASSKGWELPVLAGSFVAFAVCNTGATLLAGPLVDRYSAARMLPVALVVLIAAISVLASSSAPLIAPLYLGLAGVSVGLGTTATGAFWPVVYGITHLGAIRAFISATVVLSTAVSPVLFGWFVEQVAGMESLILTCIAYCAVGLGLLLVSLALFGRTDLSEIARQ